jgi:hypothetical protein
MTLRILFLLLFTGHLFAQKPFTKYYNEIFLLTDSMHATYKTVVQYSSDSSQKKITWYESEVLTRDEFFIYVKPAKKHTPPFWEKQREVRYHTNGKLKADARFKDNRLIDTLRMWYANGTLKRLARLSGDTIYNSQCYNPDGSNVPCTVLNRAPEFPGGEDSLNVFFSKMIIMPGYDEVENMPEEIIVPVVFSVNREGKVFGAKVLTTKAEFRFYNIGYKINSREVFNKEAVRIVKILPEWKPGIFLEEKSPIETIVHVRFVRSQRNNKWYYYYDNPVHSIPRQFRVPVYTGPGF